MVPRVPLAEVQVEMVAWTVAVSWPQVLANPVVNSTLVRLEKGCHGRQGVVEEENR